ncbi:1924_t:CDS:2, partial [Scutellospora calospora]
MKLLENPNSDASSSTDTISTNTTNCLSSLLLVKTAMRINVFNYYLSTDKKYVKADEYRQHSEVLGNFICNSHSVLLKQRIAAIQDERERMLMLYSEFVNDNIIVPQNRAVKQYTEVLWELVDELTCTFDLTNPKQHNLFKHAQEMNQDGYKRMFTFYEIGLNILDKLLQEEVYKTKKITKGRRVKNLVSVSAKEYQSL